MTQPPSSAMKQTLQVYTMLAQLGWADPTVRPYLRPVWPASTGGSRTAMIPELHRAVYIACDSGGTARYVGSVDRALDGVLLPGRIREHLTNNDAKRRSWAWVAAVDLAAVDDVRALEGFVGRTLSMTSDLVDLKQLPTARPLGLGPYAQMAS